MAKIFEVGDVLPATTQLRISWDNSNAYQFLCFNWIYEDNIKSDNNNFVFLTVYYDSPLDVYNLLGYEVAGHWSGDVDDDPHWLGVFGEQQYLIVDTSSWSLGKRTISTYGDLSPEISFYWEDVAPQGHSIIYEENGGTTQTDLTGQTTLPDPLPTTTRAGYTFVAWYIDSALTTRAVAGETIEEDTTLYAKWHTLGSLFTEIADAIRSKDGTSENIRDVDFGERVKQIQGAKEEETKTVTPNFASGNVEVTPTSGKVLSQVTINKDTNHIASNIVKDKTIYGVTGTSYIAIELTQAQYDALGTKDANTYYLIVEVE